MNTDTTTYIHGFWVRIVLQKIFVDPVLEITAAFVQHIIDSPITVPLFTKNVDEF